jgi:serine/threonine protein kinase
VTKVKERIKEFELYMREIEILQFCDHPNIIKVLDTFEDPKHFYLVTEFMDEGDLFDYLKERDFTIEEDQAKVIYK